MSGSRMYDWIAPIYDLSLKIGTYINGVKPFRWRNAFIRSLGLTAAGRVLEVGVGTGINLFRNPKASIRKNHLTPGERERLTGCPWPELRRIMPLSVKQR